MNTMPQHKPSSPDLRSPISIEVEVINNFPVMTKTEETTDKCIMTGIEEGIPLLGPYPEDIILQEAPITSH